MLNRSILPIELEDQALDPEFPVLAVHYVQEYRDISYLHYHTCLEIGRCDSGSGVQFIEGEIYPFSANSVSILSRGCIHDSHIVMDDPSEKPSVWRYLFIDAEALGVEDTLSKSFLTFSMNSVRLFDVLYDLCEAEGPNAREEFTTLLRGMMLEMRRQAPTSRPLRPGSNSDVIIVALHRIAVDYASNLTIGDLARECNMSVSYFRREFTNTVGMSPQQYIIQVRLSMAEHLLRTTTRSIQTISGDVGFRTLSSFNRLFQRKYGCAPRDMRGGKGPAEQ